MEVTNIAKLHTHSTAEPVFRIDERIHDFYVDITEVYRRFSFQAGTGMGIKWDGTGMHCDPWIQFPTAQNRNRVDPISHRTGREWEIF